ncbi:zinc finger C2HC domain-containing protein 1C [Lates japonicus]|uniref:Zinc finger C2HC domain-containing protein 1C n=1 Tax=Lates japonicus TaxID=270547 RepID=A0AAD3N0B7_LATJO|nr:zinc finger C2HC domain-containing protein 1C [Lates japonicus]
MKKIIAFGKKQHKEELGLMDSMDASFQLVPCRICNRKFASKRLEKHIQVCEKVKQTHRQVFNSYLNRTKGSAIEEFWKTHSRSKTPEVLQKKNHKQNHKANTKNMQRGRLPAGTSQPKWSK